MIKRYTNLRLLTLLTYLLLLAGEPTPLPRSHKLNTAAQALYALLYVR